MDPMPDEELVARYRAQAGSSEGEQWLNELFQRHHRRVSLWCLRLTGDRESAVDLAQEVFLKAFRYLDTFRGSAKFSTWLYSIARNHCFNEIRSRAAAPESICGPILMEIADQTPGALHRMERDSSAAVLRELMGSSLTEVETQVITLHYVDELPLDAVTRLLKLDNPSGAKAYVVSARRKLAKAMERRTARGLGERP
jgi:RNA polymerase sigma factor (sigma-70 family)